MFYIKLIFHCDAKPFALGSFGSPNAKDSTFALPNAKNTNMLVSLALGDANFLCWPCTFHFFCITPDASQWNIGGVGSPTQNFRVGHVHFMLFMSISFASGTQRKLVFQWNMGLKVICRWPGGPHMSYYSTMNVT